MFYCLLVFSYILSFCYILMPVVGYLLKNEIDYSIICVCLLFGRNLSFSLRYSEDNYVIHLNFLVLSLASLAIASADLNLCLNCKQLIYKQKGELPRLACFHNGIILIVISSKLLPKLYSLFYSAIFFRINIKY